MGKNNLEYYLYWLNYLDKHCKTCNKCSQPKGLLSDTLCKDILK